MNPIVSEAGKKINDVYYNGGSINNILLEITPLEFMKEYRASIDNDMGVMEMLELLDSVDSDLGTKYKNFANAIENFKKDFDIIYPMEDYPELYIWELIENYYHLWF